MMIREMDVVCPLTDLLSSSDLQVMLFVATCSVLDALCLSQCMTGAVHVILPLATWS